MHEHHIPVTRTARYFTLGPAGAASSWFVLHGYRQLARGFLKAFGRLDDGHRRIVAPEALSRDYTDAGTGRHGPDARVGATWMTREDRETEIRDYVAYLDAVADAEGQPDVVLGFSQGTATASRWVCYGAVRPGTLVLWAGPLAHDLDRERGLERLGGVNVIFVVGTDDPGAGVAVAEQMAWLEAAGVACRRLEYEGGHRIEPAGLDALAEASAR